MHRTIAAFAFVTGLSVPACAVAQVESCAQSDAFRVVRELRHPKPIVGLAASRDARYVLSADTDGTLTLWDFSDGKRAHEVWVQDFVAAPIGPGNVLVAFSPAEDRFFAAVVKGGRTLVSRFDYFPDTKGCVLRRTEYGSRDLKELRSIAVSRDGKLVALGGLSSSQAATVELLDIAERREAATIRLAGYRYAPLVAFAGSGAETLLFTAEDSIRIDSGPVRVFDLRTPQTPGELRRSGGKLGTSALGVAADGNLVVAGFRDGVTILWRRTPGTTEYREVSTARSGDGQRIGSAGVRELPGLPPVPYSLSVGSELRTWSDDSKHEARTLEVFSPEASLFVPRRPQLMLAPSAGVLRLVDPALPLEPVFAHRPRALGGALGVVSSPDGDSLLATYAAGDKQRVGLLLNTMTGAIRRVFEEPAGGTGDGIYRFAGQAGAVVSPSLQHLPVTEGARPMPAGALLSAFGDAWLVPVDGVRTWRIGRADAEGKPVELRLPDGFDKVLAFDASLGQHDAVLIAAGPSQGTTFLHWSARGREFGARLPLGTRKPRGVAISNDGTLAIVDADEALLVELGQPARPPTTIVLPGAAQTSTAAFARGGRAALIGTSDGDAYRLEEDGRLSRMAESGMRGKLVRAAPGWRAGTVLTAGDDGAVRAWNLRDLRDNVAFLASEPRARLAGQRRENTDIDWTVVDADGRFHAANPAEAFGVHWARGLAAIAPGQLRQQFHDPALLGKHLGLSSELLLAVDKVERASPAPTITLPEGVKAGAQLRLVIREPVAGALANYSVSLNGNEVFRRFGVAAGTIHETIDVRLFQQGRNQLVVRALDTEGNAVGRGSLSEFDAPQAAAAPPPRLFALVAGVSKYESDKLTLKWADSDAVRFAKALEIAARAQLGPEGTVVVRTLTSEPAGDVRLSSRRNILDTLQEFAAQTKGRPSDVVVVFFAGHGGVDASGGYFFVAAGASPAKLGDPAARADVTVSALELKAALAGLGGRRLLVFDTCNSRAFAEGEDGTRDAAFISAYGRSITDLDPLQGAHVLYGSWDTRVAYEHPRYKHGLLTYALLSGMLGLAQDDDGALRAMGLFRYAQQQVPLLASAVAKKQPPQYVPAVDAQVGRYDSAGWKGFEPLEGRPVVGQVTLLRRNSTSTRDLHQDALRRLLAREAEGLNRFVYAPNRESAYAYTLGAIYENAPSAEDPTGRQLKATYSVASQKAGEESEVTSGSVIALPDELAAKVYAAFIDALKLPPAVP